MSVEGQLVERLHAVLVEEIRSRRPHYLQQPFTVAEIYQDLVPYRSHRDRIGASMNGDYEHALLKLLAGEGDFVVLESEQARKRLLSELESSNPNTGIFRDYAALDVWLNPARIPEVPPPAPPRSAPSAAAATSARSPAPETPPPAAPVAPELSWEVALAEKPRAPSKVAETKPSKASPRSEPQPTPPVVAKRSAIPATAAPTSAPSTCRWCKSELPRRESLHFCPFCGMDVNVVPCPSCGDKLEAGWRYCISCGTQVPGRA